MSEWKPIETAPKDGTRIDLWAETYSSNGTVSRRRFPNVCWGERAYTRLDYMCTDKGWTILESEMPRLTMPTAKSAEEHFPSHWHPTHWMPLPEPPTS